MSYGLNQYESALKTVKTLKENRINPTDMDIAAFCIEAVIKRTKEFKKVW